MSDFENEESIQNPKIIVRCVQLKSKILRISNLRRNMKYQISEKIQQNSHLSDSSDSFNLEKGEEEEKNINNHKKIINTCLIYIKKGNGQYEIIARQQIKKTKALRKKDFIKNSRKFQKRLNTVVSKELTKESLEKTEKPCSGESKIDDSMDYQQKKVPVPLSGYWIPGSQMGIGQGQIQTYFGFPVFVNY